MESNLSWDSGIINLTSRRKLSSADKKWLARQVLEHGYSIAQVARHFALCVNRYVLKSRQMLVHHNEGGRPKCLDDRSDEFIKSYFHSR